MKKKTWMPLVMVSVMTLGMIAIMGLAFFLFGGSSMLPMLSLMFGGGESLGLMMLVPVVMVLAMAGLMVVLMRWMMGGSGPMARAANSPAVPTSEKGGGELTRLVFDVPDVSCAHCKMAIEAEIGDLPGVASVEVDVESRQAVVDLVNVPTRNEIEARLSEIGYPAD